MRIGKAFIGERVAVRRTNEEHIVEVYFATHLLHTFDLSKTRYQIPFTCYLCLRTTVTYVSVQLLPMSQV